jgi:acyl-CoA reductase-like NAD-dependent aldehyde dehydrogenase
MQKLDWSHFYNTVDGKLESTSQTRHGIDPATGEAGPDVPVSTAEDVDRATAAAQKAFTSYS